MKKLKFPKPSRKFFKSKRFLISIALVAVVVVGVVLGTSIARDRSLFTAALNNLAEARHYMKHAESDTLRVQFFSGMREEPFAMDGRAGRLVPFAIINVDPKDNSLRNLTQIDGHVRIGTEQISISLAKNPYDRNFAMDLARAVEEGTDISITLFITSTDHPTFNLTNAMEAGSVDWKTALQAATGLLGDRLPRSGFEVYVRIVNDQASDTGAFWYVQFITSAGQTFFAVVAPDGAVLG